MSMSALLMLPSTLVNLHFRQQIAVETYIIPGKPATPCSTPYHQASDKIQHKQVSRIKGVEGIFQFKAPLAVVECNRYTQVLS